MRALPGREGKRTRVRHGRLLVASLSGLACLVFSPSLRAQPTIQAATCNLTDVQDAVNQAKTPGTIVRVPAGSCTWTSTLTITGIGIVLTGTGTANCGSSSLGAGTSATTIIDNAGTSNPMIDVSKVPYGQTFELSLLDINPLSPSTQLMSPVFVVGTCTSAGCPTCGRTT
jgi:hypothetical protein